MPNSHTQKGFAPLLFILIIGVVVALTSWYIKQNSEQHFKKEYTQIDGFLTNNPQPSDTLRLPSFHYYGGSGVRSYKGNLIVTNYKYGVPNATNNIYEIEPSTLRFLRQRDFTKEIDCQVGTSVVLRNSLYFLCYEDEMGQHPFGLKQLNLDTGAIEASFSLKSKEPSRLGSDLVSDGNNLWLTHSEGLIELNPETGKSRLHKTKDIIFEPEDCKPTLLESNHTHVWAVCGNKLMLMSGSNKTWSHYTPADFDNFDIAPTTIGYIPGKIYVSTDRKKVYEFNSENNQWKEIGSFESYEEIEGTRDKLFPDVPLSYTGVSKTVYFDEQKNTFVEFNEWKTRIPNFVAVSNKIDNKFYLLDDAERLYLTENGSLPKDISQLRINAGEINHFYVTKSGKHAVLFAQLLGIGPNHVVVSVINMDNKSIVAEHEFAGKTEDMLLENFDRLTFEELGEFVTVKINDGNSNSRKMRINLSSGELNY